jgi:hypothetical protein
MGMLTLREGIWGLDIIGPSIMRGDGIKDKYILLFIIVL